MENYYVMEKTFFSLLADGHSSHIFYFIFSCWPYPLSLEQLYREACKPQLYGEE